MKFDRTDRLTAKQAGFVGSTDLQNISVEAGPSHGDVRGFRVGHESVSAKSDLVGEHHVPGSPRLSPAAKTKGRKRESQDFATQRLDTALRGSADEGPLSPHRKDGGPEIALTRSSQVTVKIGPKGVPAAGPEVQPLDKYGAHVSRSVNRHPPHPGVILGSVTLAS